MTQIFDSLGWALLHSLWQGGLAMLAVIMFRGITKNTNPALRYNFQIMCLFGCFAAFLVTFGLHQNGHAVPSAANLAATSEAVSQAAAIFTRAPESLQLTTQNISVSAAASAPLLGGLWCLGFAFMAARYLAAYMMTRKLRHTGLTEVSVSWQNRFRTLVLNSGVSENVRLYVSKHVSGPLTIGFIKPVVLVPAGFLMGLPRDQVEAILLHELAHIRRYDYLVNLMQTAVKTVLFFHPAIHFISGKIDIDREQACDDLAVAQSRNPQALIHGLAALRLNLPGHDLAMTANGKRNNGDTLLTERLKRLAGSTEHQRRPEHLLITIVTTLLMGGIYISVTAAANPQTEQRQLTKQVIESEQKPQDLGIKTKNNEPKNTLLPAPSTEVKTLSPAFIWPTDSRHITASFGQKGDLWTSSHNGVDFKGIVGDAIYASAEGTVKYSGAAGKWGKRVLLTHADGYQTLYAHMDSIAVSSGQTVRAGDIIGGIGSTGQSTGPHLHFELRKDGHKIDPLKHLK